MSDPRTEGSGVGFVTQGDRDALRANTEAALGKYEQAREMDGASSALEDLLAAQARALLDALDAAERPVSPSEDEREALLIVVKNSSIDNQRERSEWIRRNGEGEHPGGEWAAITDAVLAYFGSRAASHPRPEAEIEAGGRRLWEIDYGYLDSWAAQPEARREHYRNTARIVLAAADAVREGGE
jgi:hypothetical protein